MDRKFLVGVVILSSVFFIVCKTCADGGGGFTTEYEDSGCPTDENCDNNPPVAEPGEPSQAPEPEPEQGEGTNDYEVKTAEDAEPIALASGKYQFSTQDLLIRGRALNVVIKRRYSSGPSTGGTVYFNGGGSSPDGEDITGYEWTFPDEAYDISGAYTANASCKFTTPGTYTVNLKVKDGWSWYYLWIGQDDSRCASPDIECCWCDPAHCYCYKKNWFKGPPQWSGEIPVNVTVNPSRDNSRFGYGWDMSYNIKVLETDDPNIIILLDGEKHWVYFTLDSGSGKYMAPDGGYDVLEKNQDTYTLFKKHGTRWDFDTEGSISAITDRNGNSITFGYDPCDTGAYKKLTAIKDDLNREITLQYYNNGLLWKITDFATRTWEYTYDTATHDLLKVKGPTGLTTEYTYDNHNLLTAKDPDGQIYLTNSYVDNKVEEQTYGNGTYTISYNPDSNEATVTDRRDFNSVTVYNSTGNPISRTVYTESLRQSDPDSYVTSYRYNSDMEITRKTFPAGNCIDYTYDAKGNLLGIYRKTNPNDPNSTSDPNVIATIYTYESNFNFVETVTDPAGNVTTYGYDPNGNLTSITYPEVNTPAGPEQPVVSFMYNDFGQVETITAPDGIVTEYEHYDTNDVNDPNCGRLWKVIVDANETDGLNITTEYKYDILGRVIEVNDPNGNVTEFAYNDLEQLTKITAPSPYNYVTNFSYNNCKKLSQIERERTGDNQITSYTYNILDKLKTVTDPLNHITKYSYDASDNLSDVNDAEENNTHYEYDERDLLWEVTDANGDVTEYSYTANGNLSQIKDANGNISSYSYDGFDRLIKITYPDDSNEVFGYDKSSNVTSKKNRKGETIYYEYDALNRMTVKNRPGDPNIYFSYDVAGRLVEVDDGRAVSDGGGITTYYYDRIGRVNDVNDILGKVVSYQYDELSRRTVLDHVGPGTTIYTYDELSRLKQVKLGNNGVLAEYQYDELSRRTLVTLGNDANAAYTYDLANRLTNLTNKLNGSGTGTFDYTHDNVGNRLTMTVDSNELHKYTYDNLYQLTEVNYPADYPDDTVTYSYDALGNRTSVANGETTNYRSNSLNQYTSIDALGAWISPTGHNNPADWFNEGDAHDDQPYPNTAAERTGVPALGWTDWLELTLDNPVNISKIRFQADRWEEGQGISQARIEVYYGGAWDTANPVLNGAYLDAWASGWNNIDLPMGAKPVEKARIRFYNSHPTATEDVKLWEFDFWQTNDLSYDKNGNLTNNGTYKYYYDCENRLTDVNDVNDDSVASYTYDYLGRRVKKIVYGSPNVTTKYCYDGDQVIAEFDGDGYCLRRFYYGPGIDEPVCMQRTAAGGGFGIFYYHFDGLGSVVALTDTSGTFVEYYDYDVFGQPTIWDMSNPADPTIVNSSVVGNPYMFTGRRFDDETGLYYYRARYYNPYIGRFLQTDPIHYAAGLNLYTYVDNNPTNWIDPWGWCKEDKEGDDSTSEDPRPENPEEKVKPEDPTPEVPTPWDKFKNWFKDFLKRAVEKLDPLKHTKEGVKKGDKKVKQGMKESVDMIDKISRGDFDKNMTAGDWARPAFRGGYEGTKELVKGAAKDAAAYATKKVKKKIRKR